MPAKRYIIGLQFGSWIIISDAPSGRWPNGKAQRRVVCRCEHGIVKEFALGVLNPATTCECLKLTDEQRFWKNVNREGPVPEHMPHLGPCWPWTAGKSRAGYGMFRVNGKSEYTHRMAYENYFGPIPEGLSVLHKCDNPSCVSPIHIWAGTHKANSQDALKKGRLHKQAATLKRLWKEKWTDRRGENVPHKLTEETVLEIRRTYKKGVFGFKRIVKRFGISFGLAQRIIARKTWSHLKDETAPIS